jgi:hypothetical protein
VSGHHAIIAPSSMDRTVACQAWIQLSQGLPPEPDTEDTLEGNAADWVAKQYANGNEVPYGSVIPLPGGFKVDHDMIHGAKMWTNALGYGAISGVPVVCERIHPTDCWGEPDGWRWDAIDGVLRLPDYKYGFGTVEVFENWQLIPYASGLIDTLGLVDTEVMIEFKIVQPRAHHKDGPVRTWRVRGDKIRALVNQARDAAIHAWPPPEYKGVIAEPVAKTGPHCLHCPARIHCRTFQAAVSNVLTLTGAMDRVAMDAAAVGTQLVLVQDAIEILKAQETSLTAQAESFIRGAPDRLPQMVPNFAMESGQSRLLWLESVTADEILSLGAWGVAEGKAAIDLKRHPKNMNSNNGPVVTPTQAIKAGVDAAVISQYASRTPTSMKLARTSTAETRRIFGDNSQ